MTDHTSAVERLPPLPEARDWFTAKQMRAYALAAIKQDSEAGAVACDTGNLVSDPLYEALDALYTRGWADLHKGRDHDPRGTVEWQRVLDLFRARARPAAALPEVTDAMVGRALSALLTARGTYENEVPVVDDEIRAALTAALRPETQGNER